MQSGLCDVLGVTYANLERQSGPGGGTLARASKRLRPGPFSQEPPMAVLAPAWTAQ